MYNSYDMAAYMGEKQPPYNTGAHHHCEIVTTGHQMMPNYVLQLVIFGTVVSMAVLVIGVLIALDVRIRLNTPVVRARRIDTSQDRPSTVSAIETKVKKAFNVYDQLNDNKVE